MLALPAPVSAQSAPGEPLAVLVHADWPGLHALPLPVLRQVYLGRRTRLSGLRVACVDLPAGTRARQSFVEQALLSDERSLERYWLRQALAGGSPPPREMQDAEAVLAYVATKMGAIGYVPWAELPTGPPDGARVLRIRVDGRNLAPSDPGYPLRVGAQTVP